MISRVAHIVVLECTKSNERVHRQYALIKGSMSWTLLTPVSKFIDNWGSLGLSASVYINQ